MSENTDRRLLVLWADDVQKGPNDKVNLLGVYGTEMWLPEPTTVPQIYAFVEISTSLARPFKSIRLMVRATNESSDSDADVDSGTQEILLDFTVPASALSQVIETAARGESEGKHPEGANIRTALRVGLPISGLKVNKRRYLTVRAETEEGPMFGETLLVLVRAAQPT
ncbi:hypothetical protein [Burkholderia sp. AU16741]|uniref:hypothetical protein n=1 Tax=Burkholderia sp. AU16741 TaxID=2015347 RepID=UPI00117DD27E|nr:hypothetical protein [Burkholderia sp. AU16741]